MPLTRKGTGASNLDREWMEIASAPFGSDLEVAVLDGQGIHRLAFPCRRILGGWMDANTKERLVQLQPTHWRMWHGSDLPAR